MRRGIILILFFLAQLPFSGWARTHEPVSAVQAYRAIGETRVWTFEQRDVVLGSLRSTVEQGERISDSESVQFTQSLEIDFTRTGGAAKLTNESKHSVSLGGWFLEDMYEVPVDGGLERQEVVREGNFLTTTTTRASGKESTTTPIERPYRSYEPYQIDLLELYLANQFLSVGQVIIDTLYAPRTHQTIPIALNVQEFSNRRLFNQVIESVFVISMAQPTAAQLLYTPDRRLAKIDFVDLSLQVYLDEVSGKKTASAPPPQVSRESLPIPLPRLITAIGSLPHGIFYLIVGLLGALMLGARIRRRETWLALLAGAVLYGATFIPQLKAQAWFMKAVFTPAVTSGTSIYLLALPPALLLALMQELLKLAGMFAIARSFTSPSGMGSGRGAAFGAGFGFLEAFLATASFGVVPFFSATLAERSFMTLIHATLGALLGSRIGTAPPRVMAMLVVTLVINALVRYLPIFVQSRVIDVTFAQLTLGFVALVLLGVVLLIHRRKGSP